MIKRHHFQFLVFFIGTLMLLLRPYVAYQIAGRPGMAKDPAKVNGILQRLIKKKDEHHALADNDLIALKQPGTSKLPAIRALLIIQMFLAFAQGIRPFAAASTPVFRLFSNKHYLLFARLQI